MAITDQQIFDFFLGNPTDDQTFEAMKTFGISPQRIATATGTKVEDIIPRLAPFLPRDKAVLLGDTWIQGNYQYMQSGEDNQLGPIESIQFYKTTGGIYDKIAEGTDIQNYSPSGEFLGTSKMGKDLSFFGGIKQALKDPYVLGALALATAGATGLLSGGAATVGTTGLTAAELAAYDLALGGAGGTAGATSLAGALTTGANVGTLTNLTGGSGVGTVGVTGANSAFLGEGVLSGVPASDLALANAPTGLLTTPVAPPVVAPPVVAPPVVAPPVVAPPVVAPPVVAPPVVAPPVVAPPVVAPPVVAPPVVIPPLVSAVAAPIISSLITPANVANLVNTGATTAAGLLQQQTSREAALAAQQRIDAETAAAKTAAQFRPIGMTTRFGTSQFQVDPITGQLTSAGYTLSPEAKNAQDRLVKLAERGLQQAESAQAQFAPLQAGAQQLYGLGQGYLDAQTDPRLAQIASQYLSQSPQSQRLTALGGDYLTQSPESKMLTSLGSRYIAQSPEQVAQNYLNQQMALLQPGRETELANLQNRLQQQGRGGLSVAQGGTLGATTPELQALYNARAQQELQLAAGAQQAGQQQVQFGAGLVGTGQQLGMAGQQFGANLIGTGQQLGIQGQQFGMDTLARQQALEQQRLAFGSGLFSQGAGLMGQYYGGQQAAYQPYTTALGQVQGLEQLAQQPFTLGASLGQTSATAGARMGALGLEGANISQRLATGAAATTNPYSTALSGAAANPVFGQMISGLFGNQATTALDFSAYGTGDAGFNRMIQDIYG